MTAAMQPAVVGTAPGQGRLGRGPLIVAVVLGVAGAAILGAILAVSLTPTPTADACRGRSCGRPPIAPPMSASEPWSSSKFGYSLDLQTPCPGAKETVHEDDSSVGWMIARKFPVTFAGAAAGDRTPDDVVANAVRADFPDATFAFAIPGAHIGYVPGYGAVYDLPLTSLGGSGAGRARLVVMASVKDGLSISVVAAGPFLASTRKNYGHPHPAATPITDCFEGVANSVTWPGESPP